MPGRNQSARADLSHADVHSLGTRGDRNSRTDIAPVRGPADRIESLMKRVEPVLERLVGVDHKLLTLEEDIKEIKATLHLGRYDVSIVEIRSDVKAAREMAAEAKASVNKLLWWVIGALGTAVLALVQASR